MFTFQLGTKEVNAKFRLVADLNMT